ncbi:hypothetical protein F4802DRAFT_433278 [Xylaria palmicola]|nr:hypothetical protein F4802DRAFT_433278 [Xylaria palmicola]
MGSRANSRHVGRLYSLLFSLRATIVSVFLLFHNSSPTALPSQTAAIARATIARATICHPRGANVCCYVRRLRVQIHSWCPVKRTLREYSWQPKKLIPTQKDPTAVVMICAFRITSSRFNLTRPKHDPCS